MAPGWVTRGIDSLFCRVICSLPPSEKDEGTYSQGWDGIMSLKGLVLLPGDMTSEVGVCLTAVGVEMRNARVALWIGGEVGKVGKVIRRYRNVSRTWAHIPEFSPVSSTLSYSLDGIRVGGGGRRGEETLTYLPTHLVFHGLYTLKNMTETVRCGRKQEKLPVQLYITPSQQSSTAIWKRDRVHAHPSHIPWLLCRESTK